MIYIMIEMVDTYNHSKKKSLLKRFLSLFIPLANPDYEQDIDLVKYWILEFENKESIPIREIGMSTDKNVLMKMPYKKNYGYWTDNQITHNYFVQNFPYKTVSEDFFISKWNLLN